MSRIAIMDAPIRADFRYGARQSTKGTSLAAGDNKELEICPPEGKSRTIYKKLGGDADRVRSCGEEPRPV